MNNMSEDEATDKLKELIARCKECKFATCENCEINWNEVQAIETILDLYKQEKEWTKKIIKAEKFYRELYNDVVKKTNERYIPKDKIREKIKKYEEINMDVFTFEVAEDLKELLEERTIC